MPQNVGLQKLCPEVSNYAHFSIWGIKKPTWQPCSQAHSKLRLGTSQARLETPGSCVKPTSPIFVAEGKEQKCNQPVPPDIAQLRENGASGTHMGAAEISAGGTKKFFQGGGLQKKTQGGGLFSKLRVWVGRGLKENFSSATAILEKNSLKNQKIFKKLVFFLHFLWVREGEALKNVNFSLLGGSIFASGRGTRF